jgi:peroxin-3
VPPKGGIFSYFSTSSMGLSDYIDSTIPSIIPNPLTLIPASLRSYIPFSSALSSSIPGDEGISSTALRDRSAVEELEKNEAERLYLCYSWWLLNEGWKGIAERVDDIVKDVFGG